MILLHDLPAEIFTKIVDELDYPDAFALKQTSRSMSHAVNIPTVSSYRHNIDVVGKTRAACLEILTKENLVPNHRAFCRHCGESYPFNHYTVAQGDLIRYSPWNSPNFPALAAVFCFECAIERGIYKPGDLIQQALNRDGHILGAVSTPCYSCKWLCPLEVACQSCRACERCFRAATLLLNKGAFPFGEVGDRQNCLHREGIEAHESDAVAWSEARDWNRRCRWFRLRHDLQCQIAEMLDDESVLALRLACSAFARFFIRDMRRRPRR